MTQITGTCHRGAGGSLAKRRLGPFGTSAPL